MSDFDEFGYSESYKSYRDNVKYLSCEELQKYLSKMTFEEICEQINDFSDSCLAYDLYIGDYAMAIKTCEYMLLMANIWEKDDDDYVRKTAKQVSRGCRKILLDDLVSITEEEHKSMMGAMRKAEARVNSYDRNAAYLIRESNRNFFNKINPIYSKSCYVATAIYGSYDKEEVCILRNFRDQYLLKSKVGKKFVKWYYKNSPKWVDKYHNNKVLTLPTKFILDQTVKILKRTMK